MAFPHPPGLLPPEIAFLCEMELVTIIPRQRLQSLDLLGGPTTPLSPPNQNTLPLWLALLLKRQKRANILPPPWLHPDSLTSILELESDSTSVGFVPPPPLTTFKSPSLFGSRKAFYTSPPFLASCTVDVTPEALPYHWLELSELLLAHASDDLIQPDVIRRLIRDLREVRMAKMRKGVGELSGDGEGVQLDGVGAMEVGEARGFIGGVVEGLRVLGGSREQAGRERREEGRRNGSFGGDEDDEDDEMS